jgi:hypothetical protein
LANKTVCCIGEVPCSNLTRRLSICLLLPQIRLHLFLTHPIQFIIHYKYYLPGLNGTLFKVSLYLNIKFLPVPSVLGYAQPIVLSTRQNCRPIISYVKNFSNRQQLIKRDLMWNIPHYVYFSNIYPQSQLIIFISLLYPAYSLHVSAPMGHPQVKLKKN